MSYIGNTSTTQAFTPAVDFFSGNASTVAFTLSRPVASVAQVEVYVSNVPQTPNTAFSVSGNTITFTSAPPTGTNNIYVYYTSPITQVIAPSQGTVSPTSLSTGGPTWDANSNFGIFIAAPTSKLQVNYVAPAAVPSAGSTGHAIAAGSQYYGIASGALTNGNGYMQVTRWDGTATNYDFLLQPNGGNVAIGNVTAQYSLARTLASLVTQQNSNGVNICCVNNTNDSYTYILNDGTKFAIQNSYGVSAGQKPMLLSASGGNDLYISSTGNVLMGATTQYSNEKVNLTQPSAAGGFLCRLSGGPYNNTSYAMVQGVDGTTVRFYFPSNGGLYNFSANNVNLSDVRTKTDIQDAGSYLAKICAIPVRTFKYKDQTDDLLNLGCIAQEVEAVAPELVDVQGFGDEVPEDGVPLKGIFQTDLQYALMKCIQEQQVLIQTLTDRITALENK